MYNCKYCNKEFSSKQALGGHVIWCTYNPDRAKSVNKDKECECDICKKRFKNSQGLGVHMLYYHNSSNANTNNNFNKKEICFCKYCNKECHSLNSLVNHERLCKKNPNHDKNNLENYCKIGQIAWNKGLTADTDVRVKKYTDTINEKIRTGKINVKPPKPSKEMSKKISDTIMEKSKNGEWHNSSIRREECVYKDIQFDSMWEVKYAQYLDKNNIEWERCKETFPYVFEGKTCYYNPDFKLLESNEYVEIKGFVREKDPFKWEYFPSDKKLTILMFKELKEIIPDINGH